MSLDENLMSEFISILENKLAIPAAKLVNNELIEYHNELVNSDLSMDEILLKLLTKSNELILKQSVNLSAIFSQLSDDSKKNLIDSLKNI